MTVLIKYIIQYLAVYDSPKDANSIALYISSHYKGYDGVVAATVQTEIKEYWENGGNAIIAYENTDNPNFYLLVKDAIKEYPMD